MTKVKELETLLVQAADALVKMRSALKLSTAKNSTALNELLTTPEVKQVFKWRRARRLALKDVETVPAKVVTTSTRKTRTDKRPIEARTIAKGTTSKNLVGKTIQVRTKQFTISEVILLDVQGKRAVLLDNGYVYDTQDIERTPEGKSDWSIKKGVLRIRGVKPSTSVAKRPTKAERVRLNEETLDIIANVAEQTAKNALKKLDKDIASLTAKEAKTVARTRRSGKDGVKAAASKAAKEEGFNSNRARNMKAGKKDAAALKRAAKDRKAGSSKAYSKLAGEIVKPGKKTIKRG